jgi:hypothetical protein
LLKVKLPSLTSLDKDTLMDYHKRSKERLMFPGICALEYDIYLQLVIKYIVGWDEDKASSDQMGALGKPEAYSATTEEQGRKSLHVHVLIWLEGWNELSEKLMDSETPTKVLKECVTEALAFVRNACSSSLHDCDVADPFQHEGCGTRNNRKRRMVPVEDSKLRKLRHKIGCRADDVAICICRKCGKTLDSNTMVLNVLNSSHVCGSEVDCFPDRKSQRVSFANSLVSMDHDWVQEEPSARSLRRLLLNANSNIHLQSHAKRCFKRSDECYSNFPKPVNSKIEFIRGKDEVDWYDWTGAKGIRYMIGFETKREIYDAYMNTNNDSVTMLFGCNNNIIVGLTGKAVIYICKYSTKGTQNDDGKAFEDVSKSIIKQIQQQMDKEIEEDGTTLSNDSDFKIGFRRVVAGILAHTRACITGAPMAHFLLKHQTRFKFSHARISVPVDSVKAIILGQKTSMYNRRIGGKIIPTTKAFDYIHRPKEFEHMCLYEFFMVVTTMTKGEAKRKDCESFEYTQGHPLKEYEGVVYRKDKAIPYFKFSFLPDAQTLGGEMFSKRTKRSRYEGNKVRYELDLSTHADSDVTSSREKFAFHFMLLFKSYRRLDDLKKDGWYQGALKESLNGSGLWARAFYYASNIQNIHNSLKADSVQDPIKERTDPYVA